MNDPQQTYHFNVGLQTFQPYVIDNSMQVPVLVEFRSGRSEQSRALGATLEKLAAEYHGDFLLAIVDADREVQIAQHFGVRTLPTVLIVFQGQIVDALAGVQPETEYRRRIDQYRPRPADKVIAESEALWESGEREAAVRRLLEGLRESPAEPDLQVSLAAKLLDLGRYKEAGNILRRLPEELQRMDPVPELLARLEVAEAAPKGIDTVPLEARLAADPNDHAARLELAEALLGASEHEGAAAQYLELMRRSRAFGDDAGRQGLLKLFELLGNEHPVTGTFRRRMASLLLN